MLFFILNAVARFMPCPKQIIVLFSFCLLPSLDRFRRQTGPTTLAIFAEPQHTHTVRKLIHTYLSVESVHTQTVATARSICVSSSSISRCCAAIPKSNKVLPHELMGVKAHVPHHSCNAARRSVVPSVGNEVETPGEVCNILIYKLVWHLPPYIPAWRQLTRSQKILCLETLV